VIIRIPEVFNFWRTVYSHGWCALPPFEVDKKAGLLLRTLELSTGKILTAAICQSSRSALRLNTGDDMSMEERQEVVSLVRRCLRLDEDYSEFYREARLYREFRWVARSRAGRLLRSPSVFEDVVKMICTTNCSWALTEVMVKNLTTKLGIKSLLPDKLLSDNKKGEKNPPGERFVCTFPSPAAIADCTESFLRREIRAGYRAPYLLEFAGRIVSGDISPESWRTSSAPTEELFGEVRSVKGVGNYAAGNIMKLLGRYDYLGIDSWCRKKFGQIYLKKRTATDRAIERKYEHFGKWRGLFFWMDVTRDWYAKKFPF